MRAKFDFGKTIDEVAEEICEMVMELKTVRQIAAHFGCSVGMVMSITAQPQYSERYARARDYAADLLEADIYTAAEAATPETAAADRVKIDALKWIAARRSPKRYGDKVEQTHQGPNGGPIQVSDMTQEKLQEELRKLGFGRESNQLDGKLDQ